MQTWHMLVVHVSADNALTWIQPFASNLGTMNGNTYCGVPKWQLPRA